MGCHDQDQALLFAGVVNGNRRGEESLTRRQRRFQVQLGPIVGIDGDQKVSIGVPPGDQESLRPRGGPINEAKRNGAAAALLKPGAILNAIAGVIFLIAAWWINEVWAEVQSVREVEKKVAVIETQIHGVRDDVERVEKAVDKQGTKIDGIYDYLIRGQRPPGSR